MSMELKKDKKFLIFTITSEILRILTEHIEQICSLESKLFLLYNPENTELPCLLKFLVKLGKECLGAAWWQLEFGFWNVLVDRFGKLNEIVKVLLQFVLVVAIVRDAHFIHIGTHFGHEGNQKIKITLNKSNQLTLSLCKIQFWLEREGSHLILPRIIELYSRTSYF